MQDYLLFLLLAVGAIVLVRRIMSAAPARRDERGDADPERTAPSEGRRSHLERVQRGLIEKTPLFNASEKALFHELLAAIAARGEGARLHVMGQVSLAEVIRSDGKYVRDGSYPAIVDKRLDFVIIDDAGDPLLAIEFQGPDHRKQGVQQRDAVKALALRRAGIPLLEIDYRLSAADRAALASSAIGAL